MKQINQNIKKKNFKVDRLLICNSFPIFKFFLFFSQKKKKNLKIRKTLPKKRNQRKKLF